MTTIAESLFLLTKILNELSKLVLRGVELKISHSNYLQNVLLLCQRKFPSENIKIESVILRNFNKIKILSFVSKHSINLSSSRLKIYLQREHNLGQKLITLMVNLLTMKGSFSELKKIVLLGIWWRDNAYIGWDWANSSIFKNFCF